MRFFGIVVGCIVALIFLTAAYAGATTVAERSLRELTAESPSIVHGTVVSTSSRWTENRSLIVTEIQIQVHETLKGEESSTITITQPGGRVGNLRVDADGAVAFNQGDETVLFLDRSPRGTTYVVGLSQGLFKVKEDGQGRKLVQGLNPEHLNVLRPGASAPGGLGPASVQTENVPIEEFLGGVRKMVLDAIKEGGR